MFPSANGVFVTSHAAGDEIRESRGWGVRTENIADVMVTKGLRRKSRKGERWRTKKEKVKKNGRSRSRSSEGLEAQWDMNKQTNKLIKA